MKQIVEHLQLLDNLNRKERYDLLFNLAFNDYRVRQILETTHYNSIRKIISDNYNKVLINNNVPCSLSATLVMLKSPELKNISLPSDMIYIIYKLNSDSISQSTRDDLQKVLSYTPVAQTQKPFTSSFTKTCVMCECTSNTEICFRCNHTIVSFTEYRRESFKVPLNYFNFKKFTGNKFEFLYKDWEIVSDGFDIKFTLVGKLHNSLREDYRLPFVEFQKEILS